MNFRIFLRADAIVMHFDLDGSDAIAGLDESDCSQDDCRARNAVDYRTVTDAVGVGRTKRFEITKRLVSKHFKRRCRFAPAVADFPFQIGVRSMPQTNDDDDDP